MPSQFHSSHPASDIRRPLNRPPGSTAPHRRRRATALLVAAAACTLSAEVGRGQVVTSWVTATTGNWTDPTRWTSNPNFPNNNSPPATTYDARINAVGSAYDVLLSSSVTVSTLTIGSADATLKLSGGVLTAANRLSIGGNVLQTAGTMNVTSGTAIADLHAAASYAHSGGTFNFGPNLVVGAEVGDAPTYTLSGTAQLNGVQLNVAANDGNGSFTQSGGTANLMGYLALGDGTTGIVGVYTMSAGALSAINQYVGASSVGRFTQTGGTNTIPNGLTNFLSIGEDATATGTYTLGGGTLQTSATVIGRFGAGTMMQSAGTQSISGVLRMGRDVGGRGFYSISGASSVLTIGGEADIGASGFGTLTHGGGAVTANGALYVGKNAGSRGRYTLTSGTLTANAGLLVGSAGLGTFDQSGGHVNVPGTVTVQSTGSGTYLLSAGSLTAGAMDSNGTFLQTGGVGSLGPVNGTGTISVTGPGQLTADTIRQSRLAIASGGLVTVRPNGAASGASRLGNSLAIGATARLQLNDNDLIVANGSLAVVDGYISTARNGGDWLGSTGIFSEAARTNPLGTTTLGAITGQDYLAANGAFTPFNNFAVSNTDVLVKYTYFGDTDFNGFVDFDDYVRTDNGYNNALTGWFNGDFDQNGVVDFDDYVYIDLGYNLQGGTLRPAMDFLSGDDRDVPKMNTPALRKVVQHFEQFGTDYGTHFLSAVPEPACLGALLPAVLVCVRRRRVRG